METTRRAFMVLLAGIPLSGCSYDINLLPVPGGAVLYRYDGMDHLIIDDAREGTRVFSGPPGSETLTRARIRRDIIVRDGRFIGHVNDYALDSTFRGRPVEFSFEADVIHMPRSAIRRPGQEQPGQGQGGNHH